MARDSTRERWAVSVGRITTLRDSDSCTETTLEVFVKLRSYLFAIKHPELSQILEHHDYVTNTKTMVVFKRMQDKPLLEEGVNKVNR